MEITKSQQEKLLTELNHILLLEQNQETRAKWLEFSQDLKSDSCETRIGLLWESGISFDCKFSKNGNSEVLSCIIDGISDDILPQTIHFFVEQKPKFFYFNPSFTWNDDEYQYCRFVIEIKKR